MSAEPAYFTDALKPMVQRLTKRWWTKVGVWTILAILVLNLFQYYLQNHENIYLKIHSHSVSQFTDLLILSSALLLSMQIGFALRSLFLDFPDHARQLFAVTLFRLQIVALWPFFLLSIILQIITAIDFNPDWFHTVSWALNSSLSDVPVVLFITLIAGPLFTLRKSVILLWYTYLVLVMPVVYVLLMSPGWFGLHSFSLISYQTHPVLSRSTEAIFSLMGIAGFLLLLYLIKCLPNARAWKCLLPIVLIVVSLSPLWATFPFPTFLLTSLDMALITMKDGFFSVPVWIYEIDGQVFLYTPIFGIEEHEINSSLLPLTNGFNLLWCYILYLIFVKIVSMKCPGQLRSADS